MLFRWFDFCDWLAGADVVDEPEKSAFACGYFTGVVIGWITMAMVVLAAFAAFAAFG